MSPSAETSPTHPQYSVTVWEAMGIVIGAIALMAIGVAGLVYKFFDNASDPKRATTIAQSLMDYTIPGKVDGVFGANLGGAKVAVVSSSTFPKDVTALTPADLNKLSGVELFIARVPLDVESTSETIMPPTDADKPTDTYDPFASPDFSFSYRAGEDFKVTTERTENRAFCGTAVPVRIQEGDLILNSQLPAIRAVKYDAMTLLENGKRQATLTAIGQSAEKQAESVFQSLRCK